MDNFIEQLQLVKSVNSLNQICTEIRRFYGFEFFSLLGCFKKAKAKKSYIVLKECEHSLLSHYQAKNYFFNDRTMHIVRESSPLNVSLYQQLGYKDEQMVSDSIDFGLDNVSNASFYSQAGDYGLIRFINACHGVDGRTGSLYCQAKESELFRISSFIYKALGAIANEDSIDYLLTLQEQKVLLFTASGSNPNKIADLLSISEHTVRNHLRHIRSKLQVKTMPHAVAKAISLGEIQL